MTVHKQNFTSGITKELSPKKKKKRGITKELKLHPITFLIQLILNDS